MGQNVKEHLRLALRMMLKPLVRLLISQGVSHGDFSEAAKDVYVEMAIRHFERSEKLNQSRTAILTGLTRKEVKNVIDRAMSAETHNKNFSRHGLNPRSLIKIFRLFKISDSSSTQRILRS